MHLRRTLQRQLPEGRKRAVGPIEIFRFADGLDITLMILGILASLINGACLPLMSLVLGEISDHLTSGCLVQTNATNHTNCTQSKEKQNEDTLLLTLYYVGIGVTALIFGYMQISFWVITAARQTKRIRKQFFHSVLAQDISWFDGCDIGELNTRMTDDINKISEGIGDKIALLFQNISTFSIGLTVGFVKGWKLTLVTLSTSPLIMASAAMCSRVSMTGNDINRKWKYEFSVILSLSKQMFLLMVRVPKHKGILSTANTSDFAHQSPFCIEIMCFEQGLLLILTFKTPLLVSQLMELLMLAQIKGWCLETHTGCSSGCWESRCVFFSVIHSSYCIGAAAPHFETFSVARGAAFNIFQVIDTKPRIDNFSTTGYKPECIEGTVEFKNVSFNYPARPSVKILKGLNLKIQSGETVAFVGPSGSGKSTAVQLLQRLYDPDDGFITVDGKDVRALNVRHYREHIGVVCQEPVLFATTVRDNIKYGRDGVTDEEAEKAAKEANAYDFIMKFPKKFDTLVGEKGAQMSGGQKQRIAIARALVRNPKILILDEATSALDTESESVVQAALEKASKGRTTIVVAHRLSTIRNADLIVTIKDGTVAEKGTHAELMAKQGLYHSLAMAQDIKKADEQTAPVTHSTERHTNPASLCAVNSIHLDSTEKPADSIPHNETSLPEVSLLKVFKLNKSEWPFVVLGTLASVLNGTVHPVFSIIFAKIITMFEDDNKPTLKHDAEMYSLMFVILGIICFISYFMQGLFYGKAGEILTMRLRHLAFRAMLYQDIAWFDDKENSIGSLTTTLATDIAQIQGIATEAVENIRTIVSLTREKVFEQMYEETLQTQHRNTLKKAQIIGSCYAFSHAFVYFAYAAGFQFGAYLVQAGRMTPEGMFVVFTAIAYGAMAIGETLVMAPEYSKAKSGAAHLLALLEKKPTIDSCSQKGKKPDTCEGNLEFREVSFFYPCRPDVFTLRGLSLRIEKGKTVAFVGSSGCGKSTSVQLLQRFYDPVEGQVLFDGIDAKELNVQWLRSQIAIVSQEPVLFNRSIAENIAYGDNSRVVPLEEIKEVANAANIHAFIEGLPEKYNTPVGLKGAQLSGGQKQRLAIARALLRKPKILLLDEATSALDNESEKVVQQALDRARRGRTCLVVAHRLSTIQNADLIVVLHNGKIKEQGTHQELLRNRDIYFKLVNAQSVH
ncbi:ATP-binding cassette sub-family B member 5 [Octodon degus]|uniref:ATP-binding cassette sub-family B member 5 n=1 Tax=Octodon degus TaxID=10160 RepID=A0A6P6DZZ3_OCTDE|nr:ATP-binding cassette sub-family B member 5 [Octodon degus]